MFCKQARKMKTSKKFQIEQNDTMDRIWQYWDLENGYQKEIDSVKGMSNGASNHRKRRAVVDSRNETFSNDELPLRGIAPGKSMGMSVMLNVKEDEMESYLERHDRQADCNRTWSIWKTGLPLQNTMREKFPGRDEPYSRQVPMHRICRVDRVFD